MEKKGKKPAKGEKKDDEALAKKIAALCDVYVNDAFGTAHRAHASTVGVTRFLPERAAGFLMIRELEALHAVMDNPARPAVAIMGGAKVSDKIGVIKNLLGKMLRSVGLWRGKPRHHHRLRSGR